MEKMFNKDDCLKGIIQDCFDVDGHTCSYKCLLANPNYSELKNIVKEKKIPFLAVSVLLGWQRLIITNERNLLKTVIYLSPCQRTFRNFKNLHEYLTLTGCNLPINFFSFKVDINIRNVFVSENVPIITDITKGEELLPISVINVYDSKTDTLANKYIKDFTYDQSVKRNDDFKFLVCCNCPDDCKDKLQCPCFQLTLQNCDPQTKLKYDISEIGYSNKLLKWRLLSGIFECNRMCKCRQTCMNRVVQLDTMFHLQIFKTFNKGWGVRTLHDIPKGSYVCRYVGNLITAQKASRVNSSNDDWKYMANLRVAQPFKEGYEDYVREPYQKKVKKTYSIRKSKNDFRKKVSPLTTKKNVFMSGTFGRNKETIAGCQHENLKRNKIPASPDSGISSGSSPSPMLLKRILRSLRMRSTVLEMSNKKNHSRVNLSSKWSTCQIEGVPIKLGRNLVVTSKLYSSPNFSPNRPRSQEIITLASTTGHSSPVTEDFQSPLTSFTSDKTLQIYSTRTLADKTKEIVIWRGISTDGGCNLLKINNRRSSLRWIYSSSVPSKGTSGISVRGVPIKNFQKLKQSIRSDRKYNLRPQNNIKYGDIGSFKKMKNRSTMRVGKFIADAKIEGNIGRYINHSCEPNIFPQLVFTESQDLNFPSLALFTCKDVIAGTELTWDYNYEVEDESTSPNIPCYCESKSCKGRLC